MFHSLYLKKKGRKEPEFAHGDFFKKYGAPPPPAKRGHMLEVTTKYQNILRVEIFQTDKG